MTDDLHLVPAPSSAEQLQWLVDRALIVETVYLYATAVDSRDWKLYRSIFTDMVEEATKMLAAERVSDNAMTFQRFLDLRYEGQEFAIKVPSGPVERW